MKKATLCFLVDDKKVCLAMKKRGFGVGKWNGVGGKLEEGETPLMAVIRETKEEIGVDLKESLLEEVGVLNFYYLDKPEWDQIVHVFLAKGWDSEPVETEEMSPAWYSKDNLPFDNMWVDDPCWLPLLLKNGKINGEFYFDDGGKVINRFEVM
jgi:8-oxo-dGTP pyrophosphatase MutT (NUDIX family)